MCHKAGTLNIKLKIMKNGHKNNRFPGPINSWFLYFISGSMDVLLGLFKKELFQDHPKTVVEIGFGAGANMPYLKKGHN